MEEKTEIIMCPNCRGAGKAYRMDNEGRPYMVHGRPVIEPCSVCDGAGRILRHIVIEYAKIPNMTLDMDEEPKKKSVAEWLKDRIVKK